MLSAKFGPFQALLEWCKARSRKQAQVYPGAYHKPSTYGGQLDKKVVEWRNPKEAHNVKVVVV